MITAIVILSLLLTASVAALAWMARIALDLQDRLEEVVEAANEARSVVQAAYADILQASQAPTLSDEPVVRRFVDAVGIARSAMEHSIDVMEPTQSDEEA